MQFAQGGRLGHGLYGASDPRKAATYSQGVYGDFMLLCRFNLADGAQHLRTPDTRRRGLSFDEFAVYADTHCVVLWLLKLERATGAWRRQETGTQLVVEPPRLAICNSNELELRAAKQKDSHDSAKEHPGRSTMRAEGSGRDESPGQPTSGPEDKPWAAQGVFRSLFPRLDSFRRHTPKEGSGAGSSLPGVELGNETMFQMASLEEARRGMLVDKVEALRKVFGESTNNMTVPEVIQMAVKELNLQDAAQGLSLAAMADACLDSMTLAT